MNAGPVEPLVERLVENVYGEKSLGLYQLSMRILSSRINPISMDLIYLKEKMKKRLRERPENQIDMGQIRTFEELFTKFTKTNSHFQQKGSLMCLLLSLMNSSDSSTSIAVSSLPPALGVAGNRYNPTLHDSNGAKVESSFDASSHFQTQCDESLVADQRKGNEGKKQWAEEVTKIDVSENILIREVLYAFQGITSDYIIYNKEMMSYDIAKSINIPPAMRDLIRKLSEMGWLYTHVSCYLRKYGNDDSFGIVGQSFCYALQTELTDYYRLLAILESQVDDEATCSPVGNQTNARSIKENELTMKRLFVWAQEPLERLRFMAALVENVEGLRGGALCSGIFAHSRHGDPFVRNFVHKIMTQIAMPIFGMIRRWVFEGELEDPLNEFFIDKNDYVGKGHIWWSEKYVLRKEMLPTFIDDDLAKRILVTGKSINYIRRNGGMMENIVNAHAQAEPLTFLDLDKLQVMVLQASRVTNKYLLNLLFDKHNLLEHLRALKQYLLLGQGDFIQYLMDLLGPELSKTAQQIYRHNLMNVLETAINSSNAKYESAEILNCLDFELYNHSTGDDGWDVFALHYKLPPSISFLICESDMDSYMAIFHFLWKLKRVEYTLSSSWSRDMNYFNIVHGNGQALSRSLQQAYLLRSKMVHFAANLHNYMMFEVLETSWRKLKDDIQNVEDMDELMSSHSDYLSSIKQNALMSDKSKEIQRQLHLIFGIIIKFCRLQDLLYTSALREAHHVSITRSKIEKSTKDGKWGTTERDEKEMLPEHISMQANNQHLLTQIESCSSNYEMHFAKLLEMLQTQCASLENLRYLTFRLDFNEFYNAEKK